jgi:hypothetical protein
MRAGMDDDEHEHALKQNSENIETKCDVVFLWKKAMK